jgi:hypothetical protein
VSLENDTEGQYLYAAGDAETREWFHKQWRLWPKRADERFTTNISFHYGGVKAFRIEHGCDPKLSRDFAGCVGSLDRLSEPSADAPTPSAAVPGSNLKTEGTGDMPSGQEAD